MTEAGGIYVPWYLWLACAVFWVFALIGLSVVARTFWQFTRPFRPFSAFWRELRGRHKS